MTNPPYIELGDDQSLLQPGLLNSTLFFIFILKGNKTNIQNLLDRAFNTPSGDAVHYQAFSDYVALMFTHVDHLNSAAPEQGWIAYHDIALWVPAMVVKKEGPITIAQRLVMTPPYIFVDSGRTMVTGRETFGLPKAMGMFNMPDTHRYMGTLTVDTVGFKKPGMENIWQRLWEVQKVPSTSIDSGETLAGNALNSMSEVVDELKTLFFGNSKDNDIVIPGLQLIEELFTGIRCLGLKQFRDAGNGNQACYQAIIEAPLKPVGFHGGFLMFDKFEFILNDLASHPVSHDIGLSIGVQPVVGSLWVNLDMEMGNGQVIWEAPTTANQVTVTKGATQA